MFFPPALGAGKSHPESSQGPSDVCNLYSQMLYQLSYSRRESYSPRLTYLRRKREHRIAAPRQRKSVPATRRERLKCAANVRCG